MKSMMIIICMMIGNQIYEQPTFANALDSIEKTTSWPSTKTGKKQTNQLVVSNQRVYDYIENIHVSKKQNVYDILTQEKAKAFDWSTVPEINSEGTIIDKSLQQSGKPPLTSKEDDCECGKDCICAPGVCKKKHCKHNYAVIFGAKWCSYCPRMKPVMKTLKRHGYIVFYVDTDKHPVVIKRFKLRLWPTTVIMNKGKPVIKFSGVTSADKLAQHLKTYKEQGLKPEKDK